MSRHTKDKKKLIKQKQKDKAQAQLEENAVSFDIISLLKTEQIDTKPNLGKFLKQYVKQIRGLNQNSKICFYPTYSFKISKVFVKFLDGHELIYDIDAIDGKQKKFFLYFNTEEIQMNSDDIEAVQKFFDFLISFKFVFSV